MRYNTSHSAAYMQALDSISCLIVAGVEFPEKVVSIEDGRFFFAPSDNVFSKQFVDTVIAAIKAEASNLVCMASIDHSRSRKIVPIFEFDLHTTGDDYWNALTRAEGNSSLIEEMGRYVIGSEKANWLIYVERANDIAVVCIRNTPFFEKLVAAFQIMPARPLANLLVDGSHQTFPFTHLTRAWLSGLLENYT